MKLTVLAAALTTLVTTALSSTAVLANDTAKHGYNGHRGYVTPYVRPGVVHAPSYGHHYGYNTGHGYRHHNYVQYSNPGRHYGHHSGHHNGYWRNGNWIAPVLLGAAILGSTAVIANNYYPPVTYAPPVTYVQPTYVQPVVSGYAGHDTFSQADRDQNGVIDKVEASYDRAWERWFYDIDRNNDGVLARHEVAEWNRLRGARAY